MTQKIHLVRGAREARRVADFNTLPELIKHSRAEGATHYAGHDTETRIYFPRGDGQYEEATVWKKANYWHAQGPGARMIVGRPPRDARPIPAHAPRHAAAEHRAAEPNDAKDVLDGLGRYLEHEGHDAAREASRIARLIRGARSDRKAEEVLEEVNKLIGGHGVEAIRDENENDSYYGDVVATYVNMGDTYDATLLYDVRNNEFHITSWGDWYENYEQQRDAEREEEAPESEPYDEDLEEARSGSRYTHRQNPHKALLDTVYLDGIEIGVVSGPFRDSAGSSDYYLWRLYGASAQDRPPFGSAELSGRARSRQAAFNAVVRADKFAKKRHNQTREASVVQDYIAVDRNDRKVAGPFRSQGEASQHVPPGGYVKFSSARRGLPPGAPKPPSAYPMFREKVSRGRRRTAVMARNVTLTATFSNGDPKFVVTAPSLDEARSRMQTEMLRRFGGDAEIEYFEDRGLVWSNEEDSIDDDGARAVASIYES